MAAVAPPAPIALEEAPPAMDEMEAKLTSSASRLARLSVGFLIVGTLINTATGNVGGALVSGALLAVTIYWGLGGIKQRDTAKLTWHARLHMCYGCCAIAMVPLVLAGISALHCACSEECRDMYLPDPMDFPLASNSTGLDDVATGAGASPVAVADGNTIALPPSTASEAATPECSAATSKDCGSPKALRRLSRKHRRMRRRMKAVRMHRHRAASAHKHGHGGWLAHKALAFLEGVHKHQSHAEEDAPAPHRPHEEEDPAAPSTSSRSLAQLLGASTAAEEGTVEPSAAAEEGTAEPSAAAEEEAAPTRPSKHSNHHSWTWHSHGHKDKHHKSGHEDKDTRFRGSVQGWMHSGDDGADADDDESEFEGIHTREQAIEIRNKIETHLDEEVCNNEDVMRAASGGGGLIAIVMLVVGFVHCKTGRTAMRLVRHIKGETAPGPRRTFAQVGTPATGLTRATLSAGAAVKTDGYPLATTIVAPPADAAASVPWRQALSTRISAAVARGRGYASVTTADHDAPRVSPVGTGGALSLPESGDPTQEAATAAATDRVMSYEEYLRFVATQRGAAVPSKH